MNTKKQKQYFKEYYLKNKEKMKENSRKHYLKQKGYVGGIEIKREVVVITFD